MYIMKRARFSRAIVMGKVEKNLMLPGMEIVKRNCGAIKRMRGDPHSQCLRVLLL